MPAQVQYYRANVELLPDIQPAASHDAQIERLQADLQASRLSCTHWEVQFRQLKTEQNRMVNDRIPKVKKQMEDWYKESILRQQKSMELEHQAKMQDLERRTEQRVKLRDDKIAEMQQRHEQIMAQLNASDKEVRRLHQRLEDAQEQHMDQGRRQAHFLMVSRQSPSPGTS